LVCYLDTKGDLRLISPPTSIQKEKLLQMQLKVKNGSLILYTNNNTKATQNNIKEFFNFISPYQNIIYNKEKKIKAKKIFYLDEIVKSNDLNEAKKGIYFVDEKDIKIFIFRKVHIVYTNSNGEYRYIFCKIDKKEKYSYEKNSKGILDISKQTIIKQKYDCKIVSYHKQVENTFYELLFLSELKENIVNSKSKDIYYIFKLEVADIKIDIFPQLKNIIDLDIKQNHIIMVDDKRFTNVYSKILYRFRNSIAHAEFGIMDSE